jgi:hypothetical protein
VLLLDTEFNNHTMIRITLILSAIVATASAFTSSSTISQQSSSKTLLQSATLPSVDAGFKVSDDILSNPMFIPPSTSIPGKRSPDELIAIAKNFLAGSNGLGGDPTLLASDFTFEGPVVGPLTKDAFVKAIGSVDFTTAFPNWVPQFYGFHVDPLEYPLVNRVWYTARGRGVNDGPLAPFVTSGNGSGKEVINPPQVCSITIDNDSGLITRYTIGYVVDRNVGNTGGLGGLYGILYAMGSPLPFPEAQPWKKSWQYDIFQKLGALLQG